MDVKTAIPIVMGANIGTSMTSTLVSLTHVTDPVQFERAFSAATVHDCFNWCAVIVLLVIEVCTGYLYTLTGAMLHINDGNSSDTKLNMPNFLKAVTEPFTDLIIQVDRSH